MRRSSKYVTGWLSGQGGGSVRRLTFTDLDAPPPIMLTKSMEEQLAMEMLPPAGFMPPSRTVPEYPPILDPPSPAISSWSARSTQTVRPGGLKNGVINSVVCQELRINH